MNTLVSSFLWKIPGPKTCARETEEVSSRHGGTPDLGKPDDPLRHKNIDSPQSAAVPYYNLNFIYYYEYVTQPRVGKV